MSVTARDLGMNYGYVQEKRPAAGALRSLLLLSILTVAASRGARNLWTLTVTGAAAVTTTCTVDGVAVSVTGSAASAAASAALVYASLVASAELGHLTITYPGSGAAITIQGREFGYAFSVSFSDSGGFSATAVETTTEDSGDEIPPGIVVSKDPNNPNWVTPAAANSVSDTWTITPATPNASDVCVLTVEVEQLDGTWISYHREVAAAGTVKLTVEAIEPVVEAIPGVSSSEDDTKVTLVNDLAAGLRLKVSSSVRGTNGTTLTDANPTQANGNLFAGVIGVARLEQNREAGLNGANVNYEPGDEFGFVEEGDIYILTDTGVSLSVGGSVYVRLTAGAGEQVGAIRGDVDGGDAVPARGWVVSEATKAYGNDGQTVTGVRVRRQWL